MPEPMTKEQLAEIRKRAEAATDGPWEGREFAHEATPWSKRRVYRVEIVSPILQYGKRVASRLIAQMIDYCDWTDHPANLAFITHARTDISALLAEVELLTAELEEWKAAARGHTVSCICGGEAQEDSERFVWYFSGDPKPGDFVIHYLEGVRKGFGVDDWRKLIDAARKDTEITAAALAKAQGAKEGE